MGEFTLDTSGMVKLTEALHINGLHYWPGPVTWDQLPSPFAQGYVEAALQGLSVDVLAQWLDTTDPYRAPGFADLAPETLAAMLRDCERFTDVGTRARNGIPPGAKGGAEYWRKRQAGEWPAYPPVTLYLGDDGKIHQREAR